MTVEILKFANEAEWLAAKKQDVSSTEMSALLGLNKFKSRFSLWHEKKTGITEDFVENERMKWGKRLQNVIAHGICQDNDWQGEDLGLFYIRDTETRMSCSLDVKVTCPLRGTGFLEVKNVGVDAFAAGWTDDEAPAYYEVQLMQQLHLARKAGLDISFGVLGALVGGNEPKLYFREYDPEIGAEFEAQAKAFWASIEAGEEPKPDYAIDGKVLAKVRGAVREKNTIDLTTHNRVYELVSSYDEGSDLEKQGKAMKDAAKAELLDIIGDADKAIYNGGSISAGMVAGGDVSYYREPYRNFRVFKKKAA